jgi:hypothetical protein
VLNATNDDVDTEFLADCNEGVYRVDPAMLENGKLKDFMSRAMMVGAMSSEQNKEHDSPLVGRRVVINGLVAKPELNGRTGTAVSFDDDKGRYAVKLDQPSSPYSVELDDTSSFMIKPCNLLPTV